MKPCETCSGRRFVDLEPRVRIPCPVCDTAAALEALRKALAVVDACAAYDRGEWVPIPTPEGIELRRITIRREP